MINFAHRGASRYYPENTILAFKKAIEMGCDGIELDVHKSKDNKLVVIHDEDIKRTYIGEGLVKDYTLEQLQSFKNREKKFSNNSECHIPTLEDVLKIIEKTRLILNIELKTDVIQYENIEEDVLQIIEKYNLKDRSIISSFNHNSLRKCRMLDKKIKLGALYSTEIEDVVEYAGKLGVNAIHPKLTLISEKLIKEAHENNLEVNIYTVNYKFIMKMLSNIGADGIFTDRTDVLKRILQCKK